MKFHLATASGNQFTGYGSGYVRVGAEEYREPIVVTPQTIVRDWAPAAFESLAAPHFEALAAMHPEIVILGTGRTIRFPHPSLTNALAEARIGLESMDTAAACRTYNILAAEGRNVLAAILVD